MQQEIQIKLHMSVSINSKYDEKELAEIVLRNVGFKNNCTYLHKLEFIEERGIYSDGELSDWVTVVENKDVLGSGFFRDSKMDEYFNGSLTIHFSEGNLMKVEIKEVTRNL